MKYNQMQLNTYTSVSLISSSIQKMKLKNNLLL